MRKLRATLVVVALAAVALIAPATASAAAVNRMDQVRATTLGYTWDG